MKCKIFVIKKGKICYNFASGGLRLTSFSPLIRYSRVHYIQQFSIVLYKKFAWTWIIIRYTRKFAIFVSVIFEYAVNFLKYTQFSTAFNTNLGRYFDFTTCIYTCSTTIHSIHGSLINFKIYWFQNKFTVEKKNSFNNHFGMAAFLTARYFIMTMSNTNNALISKVYFF